MIFWLFFKRNQVSNKLSFSKESKNFSSSNATRRKIRSRKYKMQKCKYKKYSMLMTYCWLKILSNVINSSSLHFVTNIRYENRFRLKKSKWAKCELRLQEDGSRFNLPFQLYSNKKNINSCAFICQLTDIRVKIGDNTHKMGS